jgi:hypothetical protein
LAGVAIHLVGTDFLNEPVSRTVFTNRDGVYEFADVKPGSYEIQEDQPHGMRDGSDTFQDPVTAVSNDIGGLNIGIKGSVFTLENHFAELGFEAQYASLFHLFASHGDPRYGSGIVFSTNPWHAFSGSAWDGYHSASITMASDGQSAVLRVIEASTGNVREGTITLDSARLRPSRDGRIITIVGRPEDLPFRTGSGEGEAGDQVASAEQYQRGADAVFAEIGDGATEVA